MFSCYTQVNIETYQHKCMQLSILASLKPPILSMGKEASTISSKDSSFDEIVNEELSKSSGVSVSLPYSPPKGTDRATWFKWYGEVYLKSPHWEEVRQKTLKRDEHRCRFCGCSSTRTNCLEVHHRDYDNLWQETDATLITLCKRCHRGMHKLKRN